MIREHIRSNVVGYVALFAFALVGTASALPGVNTVDSGDIKNGQVKANDLGRDAVGPRQVANDSLAGADIQEARLTGVDADTLDGRDSSAFHRGAGETSSGALTITTTGSINDDIHEVPGLLRVQGICTATSGGNVNLGIGNIGDEPLTLLVDARSRASIDGGQIQPGTAFFVGAVNVGDRATFFVESGGRRAMVSAISHRTGGTCRFHAWVTASEI